MRAIILVSAYMNVYHPCFHLFATTQTGLPEITTRNSYLGVSTVVVGFKIKTGGRPRGSNAWGNRSEKVEEHWIRRTWTWDERRDRRLT